MAKGKDSCVRLKDIENVVFLLGRMRPKIDLYPNTTQRVAVGGRTLFQCRVMDGDPPPKITWSR